MPWDQSPAFLPALEWSLEPPRGLCRAGDRMGPLSVPGPGHGLFVTLPGMQEPADTPLQEGEEEGRGRKPRPGSAPPKSAQHALPGLGMWAGDSGDLVAPLSSLMGNEGREVTALALRFLRG